MTVPDLYTDDETRTLLPKKRNYSEWRGQEVDWIFLQKALPLGALVRGIDQSGKRTREANMRRRARGCLPGTADTYILSGGVTLWLERKRAAGGTFGEGQEAFRDAVMANGGHWAEVRSTEDVEAACLAAGIPLRATLGEIRQRIDAQNERLPAKRKRAARRPIQTGDRITVKEAHALGLWK